MEKPPGFIDKNSVDHVCLLKKSLYGLKQAPRAWFDRLAELIRLYLFFTQPTSLHLFLLMSMMSYSQEIMIPLFQIFSSNLAMNFL